jgi:hypothetical protein
LKGEEIADKLNWLHIKQKLIGIRFGDYPSKRNTSMKGASD